MKKILPILSIVTIISVQSHSQGCSDAGVCTLHSIKNNAEAHESKEGKKNDISVGFAFGKGERSTDNYTGYLEYTRSITNQTSVTGKLGYSFVNGELANTNGWTDLFFSVNHAFDQPADKKGANKKWQKSFVLGLKLPLDGADIVKHGIHLPMPYQTSLGTIDLVLALNYNRKNFGATLALQQPLKANNENKFLPGDYPATPLTLKYWPTNEFERRGDIVGRVSYSFHTGERFSIRPSLLGIYHLGNDSYADDNKTRRKIYNSPGLTLNGNVFVDCRLKNGNGFELSIGAPFVVRDQRPDGLTRSFVTSLEYQFSF
ncbi:hypothetical protein [Terrimonas pollutisoli]|uniref:hypothetical protein n=1 Tax=Terrimonas pollutisoli TaxID=3034147 RepID=UPI0023ED549A|nr:hypothetical protein [Terrimonas sp. H1YJ31]